MPSLFIYIVVTAGPDAERAQPAMTELNYEYLKGHI